MAAAHTRHVRLFVTRLPWTACRDTLKNHFKRFGEVKDSNVVFDTNTGRSKKYGFVIYSDPGNAQKAIEGGPHIINGKEVLALLSEPTTESRSSSSAQIEETS